MKVAKRAQKLEIAQQTAVKSINVCITGKYKRVIKYFH